MTARGLLAEAAAAGVSLTLDGHRVMLRAERVPPAELLARLRAHKAEVIELLRRRSFARAASPTMVDGRSRAPQLSAASRRLAATGACARCGYRAVWRPADDITGWRCCRCEPWDATLSPAAVFAWRPPDDAGDPDRCIHCGLAMAWPRPAGLVFSDGTAAHHACHELAEIERTRAAAAITAEALDDEAELVVCGERLP